MVLCYFNYKQLMYTTVDQYIEFCSVQPTPPQYRQIIYFVRFVRNVVFDANFMCRWYTID